MTVLDVMPAAVHTPTSQFNPARFFTDGLTALVLSDSSGPAQVVARSPLRSIDEQGLTRIVETEDGTWKVTQLGDCGCGHRSLRRANPVSFL